MCCLFWSSVKSKFDLQWRAKSRLPMSKGSGGGRGGGSSPADKGYILLQMTVTLCCPIATAIHHEWDVRKRWKYVSSWRCSSSPCFLLTFVLFVFVPPQSIKKQMRHVICIGSITDFMLSGIFCRSCDKLDWWVSCDCECWWDMKENIFYSMKI